MNLENLTQYELVEKKEIQDIKSTGYFLKHKKSGARVMLMENDDNNKVFSIAFRTPPEDSTGLPHILEHSVLCGSKNFPVKDPFVELVKGSLNTFLNAMTYPDKTVYPVASCNDKDFQNLMHVYMDAVLYPNIYTQEEIFRQEGWSYNLENADDELTYNGVVYNEMKGAFSSPEGVIDRVILNSLFPDTSYANESGGDPDVIPELTYEQFLDFHSNYYHPSNSYIYLYGDMDMEEKLRWLDEEYLSEFEGKFVDSEIKEQAPFSEMIEVVKEYSITTNEPEEDNTYLSWNKVIGSILDKETAMAFQILDYALLSAPGAPLKEALIKAQIGKDILGSYDDGIYQPMFSVVAKNANEEQKGAFIAVIEDTLRSIVAKGIDTKAIEAGINYNDFHFREADYGRYPRGLMYGLDALESWIYDENEPFMYVELLEMYDKLRTYIGTDYYEQLIQKYLLDNTHGSIVIVKPEKGRTARMDQELRDELAAYKSTLSQEEIQALVEGTHHLGEYQDEPSREEDLQKIPVLKRSDINPEITPFYNEEVMVNGTKMVYHEVDTNGIGYLDFIFDVSKVPTELVPYLGVLQAALGMMDTKHYGYGELFNEINLHTGGVMGSMEVYPDVRKVQQKQYKATMEIKTKALYHKLPIAVELMQEMMLYTKFEDGERLAEILDMLKSRLQSKFQSAGHSTAIARSMSYGSVISKYKDVTNGITFYNLINELTKDFSAVQAEISDKLYTLAKIVFRPENMMVSYTADRDSLPQVSELIDTMKSCLYTELIETQPYTLDVEQKNEGFKTSSKVQYVARTGNFIDKGVPYTGALHILKVIMSYEYLWQNVRVKGGAYGCMSGFNRIGEGYFVSYRDPNLKETMEIYEGVVEYLKNFEASEEEITKFIIGTMSDLDQPMTPAAKGDRSLNLYMNGISAEMLKKERAQILNATQEDIRALYKVIEAVLSHHNLCVIGGEEKIEANQEMFKEVKDLF
ncbi:MAG: insulinase family protein [Eubacteriales bacterium]